MARPVTVSYINNIFDPHRSRETHELEPGKYVSAYIQELHPLPTVVGDWTVAVNGQLYDDYTNIVLAPDDSLVFCATPKGGGGGGGDKNPLEIVARVAVMVVAAVATAYMPQTAPIWAKMLVATAITTAGGLLINSIFPVQSPGLSGLNSPRDSIENSPTYGWQITENPKRVGQTLPVLYGKHKVIPPLCSHYVETRGNKQYFNGLYAIAGHYLNDITDIKINDQPIDNYDEVWIERRFGYNEQEPISNFDSLRTDVGIQTKFSTDWVVRQTGDCDRWGIGLVAPRGIYYANNKGGLNTLTIPIYTQYRKVGDATWRDWLGHTSFIQSGAFFQKEGTYVFSVRGTNLAHKIFKGATIRSYKNGEVYSEHKVRKTKIDERVVGTYRNFHIISREVVYYTTENIYENCSIVYVTGDPLPSGMDNYQYANPTTISGKQSSPKRWFFEIPEPEEGYGAYEYRFKFTEAPPSSSRYGSEIFLEYHQEVVDEELTYPNTALLSVRALATDQLSGAQPKITCVGERHTIFEDKAATNPAWASMHMLQDSVNGGGVPINRIVESKFEEWAEQCNNNNLTCNINFDTPRNFKNALDTIGTLGRGQVIQMGSDFTCITDFPDTAVQHFIFGMGNIEEDSFSEQWLPMQDRADEIEITYWDAEDDWERKTLTIQQEDYDTAEREINSQSIQLVGCTDRSMAARHAKMALNKNRWLTLTANWTADVDALACTIGDVVKVSHDLPQWGYSGRIIEAGVDYVKLDREVDISARTDYALEIKYSDDTTVVKNVLVVSDTTTDTLYPDSNFDTIPEQYDIFLFGELNRTSRKFKIINIRKYNDLKREIEAIEYVPEAYNDYASIPLPPSTGLFEIKGLYVQESWISGPDGSGISVIDASWRSDQGVTWNIWLREEDNEWKLVGSTQETYYRISEPLNRNSLYTVAVSFARPELGKQEQVYIRGKEAPPSDVQNFYALQSGGNIVLRWDHIPDIDLWGYEIREGLNWQEGKIIANNIQGNVYSYVPNKSGDHRFLIKAKDNSEIYSVNATSYDITVLEFEGLNVVLEQDEIPDNVSDAVDIFNYALTDDESKLIWLPGANDTHFANATDQDTRLTDYEGDVDLGYYTSKVFDLTAIVNFTLRLNAEYKATIVNVTDQTYPDRVDTTYPQDTDTSITSLSFPVLYYRISDDNINWSDWQEYKEPTQTVGRYIQLKASMDIDSDQVEFYYNQISTIADVPDKISDKQDVTISSSGETFDLSTDFGVTILVKYTVSTETLGTAPKYPVIDKRTGEFDVMLYDHNGSATSGNVDLTVRGF